MEEKECEKIIKIMDLLDSNLIELQSIVQKHKKETKNTQILYLLDASTSMCKALRITINNTFDCMKKLQWIIGKKQI